MNCSVLNNIYFVEYLFPKQSIWSFSSSYCQICEAILRTNSLQDEQFCRDMLPSLLHFGQDPVPNIRLTLARVLHQFILCSGKWSISFGEVTAPKLTRSNFLLFPANSWILALTLHILPFCFLQIFSLVQAILTMRISVTQNNSYGKTKTEMFVTSLERHLPPLRK